MLSHLVIRRLALLALVAKLCCAALTLGTNDVDTFYNFGQFIWENGLLAQYRATPEFNHTPATGWFCALAYGLSHGAGFPFLLRLPGIVADFLVIGCLLRWQKANGQVPMWSIALLALSPVSFMVSGFHGNVDSVLVLFLLLAVMECQGGYPARSGLWLGLACQVKIIPLLIAPVLFFFWLRRREALPFFLAAGAVILAGWSIPLIALPETFFHNVLGYGSNWGSWGMSYWLQQTGKPEFASTGFTDLTPQEISTASILKLVIVLGALVIAWRRRALSGAEVPGAVARVWALFFAAAPGVGAQYLVWLMPFLLVESAFWFAVITAAASVFLFVFYQTICGSFPWHHGASTAELLPRWVAWSNLPWIALVLFGGSRLARAYASAFSSFSASSLSSSSSSSSGGKS